MRQGKDRDKNKDGKDDKGDKGEESKVVVLGTVVMAGANKGPFNIRGKGFGLAGSLTIGGVKILTTRWDDHNIRGMIPDGVKGEVVVTTESGIFTGVFPESKSQK